MVKRKKGNVLERWEVAIAKSMISAKKYNDQEILSFFTRPTRTINHRLIGEIRTEKRWKSIKPSSEVELVEFLKIWPNVDYQTGLSIRGDELLIKSREAMIAAVTVFNSAGLRFRAELFIVTAIISWTYVFHAWFKREGVDYRYKNKAGNILKTKEGADKFWELSKCLENKKLPISQGIKANLDFLVNLRHEIEHRSTSRIDETVSAKLQACCINFNIWIKTEFGNQYALETQLPLALQFSTFDREQTALLKSAQDLPANIATLIESFEGNLTEELLSNSEYAYRAYFVQRTSNRAGKADISIEVIPAGSEEAIAAEKVFLKEVDKQRYTATDVVKLINGEGYPKFGVQHHTGLWKQLNAKGPKKVFGKEGDYKKSWVWYEHWVERVRVHCQENSAKYQ